MPVILKKILSITLLQLKHLYDEKLPYLIEIANKSDDVELFKTHLHEYISKHGFENKEAIKQILTLIKYDNKTIDELSTGEHIHIETITLLWLFLKEKTDDRNTNIDLFVDLYYQFVRLNEDDCAIENTMHKNLIRRWPTGLDRKIIELRKTNKERMLHLLIQKLETKRHSSQHFHFIEGMTYEEKYEQVKIWWNDFRFHLSMAIKKPSELNRFLGNSLSSTTMYLLYSAYKKGIPFFATPYYLSLLDVTGNAYDDETIRSYIIYTPSLVETFGNIRAWEKEDIIKNNEPNAAGWLLPDGHNIHRRYPEVAIMIPDTMGRACGGLCASCQRMYDFQSKRLNFEFEDLKPKEAWKPKLHRLMTYFEKDTQLRDILITGGDALMSQNKTLKNMLDAVYNMACRKRKANEDRPDGEKYAELQRIRLGTRLLAYLPMRVDKELVEILKSFREKAILIGIKQFFIQTHFQSPLEITPEAKEAIKSILSSGWTITNQLVYTVAASRRGHTAKLRHALNNLGVLCYYTFSVKGFDENYAVFTPNSRSIQEEKEEKSEGLLTDEQTDELMKCINNNKGYTSNTLIKFMKKYDLPFIATDRSVLNLPAIGKSMTFKMVGITENGKRILCFEHDNTRRHSPIINAMGDIFIKENKSIAVYLRQLQDMGENIDNYSSIWKYTESETEPHFKLYKYPDYNFKITDKISNLSTETVN